MAADDPGQSIGPGAGLDSLQGGDGHDTIHGGAGHDTIEGGGGDDHIVAGVDQTSVGGSGERSYDFPLIRLGVAADIDTYEGNGRSENVEDLLGEYGGQNDPLNAHIVFAVSNDLDHNDRLDDDDHGKSGETFTIEGQEVGLDSVQVYDASVTFADGSTGTFSAVVIQMQNGEFFLAPEPFENDDSALLESGEIESISLNSVLVDDSNLYGLRLDSDYVVGDDDLVDAGAGDDTVEGGIGDDTIEGGAGDDLIAGGDGADSMFGGHGADRIEGGDGDDVIHGGHAAAPDVSVGDGEAAVGTSSQDHFTWSGEAGDAEITLDDGAGSGDGTGDGAADYIFVGDDKLGGELTVNGFDYGADRIVLNDNPVGAVISGDPGAATVVFAFADGHEQSFTINHDNGDVFNIDDVFVQRDTLGDDLHGGAGDDAMFGGVGDDTIDGGAGDDALTGGDGHDVFVIGAGDDTISDFGASTGADIGDGDQTNNDFVDLSAHYDTVWEARADLSDDGVLNQSNAEDSKGQAVDFSDNQAFAGSTTFTGASASDFTSDTTGLICFLAGARILTPTGERAVEALRPGDEVTTLDHGARPIRWIAARRVSAADASADPGRRAIRIAAGALGPGRPARELRVSPQHRILIAGPLVRRMFGVDEALAPAKSLIGAPGVDLAPPESAVFVHFAFDHHEIVLADGALAESLYPGPGAMSALSREARADLVARIPGLGSGARPARRFVSVARGAALARRAAKNGKPLQGATDPAAPRPSDMRSSPALAGHAAPSVAAAARSASSPRRSSDEVTMISG